MADESHMESSRMVQLIETVVLEGKGTKADPHRRVAYYLAQNGAVVAARELGTVEKAEEEE
ncbi:MAG: hypothetical protein LN413_00625 [Candidatus Thermoplasmatota archaeon]|nr:hypothetical protein [Candidatus Thermoplasmatota archaeon]